MGTLVLRRLEPKDKGAFFKAFSSWNPTTVGFLFAQGYTVDQSFSQYLELLAAYERGEQLPEGFVPSTSLCGFVGSEIVGRLGIRHKLNEFLFKIGGHVGYGVLPEFRRQGFAKGMLSQALPIARDLGIERVLLTCDDDNIGSIKTIESCGGILENKLVGEVGKPMKRRYWINP